MNIIMDDSLIFYDEDESSNHTLVNQPGLTSRSALWFLQTGNKIFKRMDHYASKTMRTILHDETDLDHMDAFLIQVGTIYEPNSFGLEQLSRRIPYSNPEYLERKLTSAAERGWLEKVGERNYFVSGRGRGLRKKLLSASMTVYARIAVLTVDELERIDDLLGSVVNAAILGKNPEEKIALSWSRRFGLHDADFPLAHVRRRVVDLLAFRDDSHLAAWRPHEQFGYLWETFTYVWNNEANTPSNLAARLSYRGFGQVDYSSALNELYSRDWVTEKKGIFKTTSAGKALRDAVEAQTNSFFDSPWAVLSESENEEVILLMNNLDKALMREKQYSK